MYFAGKSHAFCPRGRKSHEVGLLKGPQALSADEQ
jgi:hypothetical protein